MHRVGLQFVDGWGFDLFFLDDDYFIRVFPAVELRRCSAESLDHLVVQKEGIP